MQKLPLFAKAQLLLFPGRPSTMRASKDKKTLSLLESSPGFPPRQPDIGHVPTPEAVLWQPQPQLFGLKSQINGTA